MAQLTEQQRCWLNWKAASDSAKKNLQTAKLGLALSHGFKIGQKVKITDGVRAGEFGEIKDFSVSGKRANLKISVALQKGWRYDFLPNQIEVINS